MQGKKDYQEKLFTDFRLSDRIPKENFYRLLKECLNLDFLYPLTKQYYGGSGQKSIDPTVFFKLCLVGYLENIISDRKLITHCNMRLDILYFLGYDIDEELPWHSTISRTHQLYPESVFEQVFTRILSLSIEKGMVSGHSQAIGSAPVRGQCLGKSAQEKKFTITFYREQYQRNNTRINSKKGRYLKTKRQSTIEPVLGTLQEFMALRKVNTIGIKQANKGMHLAATAYNLKKYLNFTQKRVKNHAGVISRAFLAIKWPKKRKISLIERFYSYLTNMIANDLGNMKEKVFYIV